MNKYLSEFERFPLFNGISRSEIMELLNYSGARLSELEPGQVILLQGDSNSDVGVVIRGSIKGVRIDENGGESAAAVFAVGELFGEILSGSGGPSPVTVSAAERAVVLLIPFDNLARCSGLPGGARLLKNLFAGIAAKYFNQRRRLEILSERTIRAKIVAYLNSLGGEEPVRVPISREQLASYLCCDRSALCRELSRMQKEGLIEYKGDSFRLLGK